MARQLQSITYTLVVVTKRLNKTSVFVASCVPRFKLPQKQEDRAIAFWMVTFQRGGSTASKENIHGTKIDKRLIQLKICLYIRKKQISFIISSFLKKLLNKRGEFVFPFQYQENYYFLDFYFTFIPKTSCELELWPIEEQVNKGTI